MTYGTTNASTQDALRKYRDSFAQVSRQDEHLQPGRVWTSLYTLEQAPRIRGHFATTNASRTRFLTEKELRQSIKHLRSDLTELMMHALRAVDYTGIACGTCRAEIARHALLRQDALDGLGAAIISRCSGLRESNAVTEATLLVLDFACNIGCSLLAACKAANQTSQHVIVLLDGGEHARIKTLAEIGHCITRSLRLCIVSFATRHTSHASTALRLLEDCQPSSRPGTALLAATRDDCRSSTCVEAVEATYAWTLQNICNVARQLTLPSPFEV